MNSPLCWICGSLADSAEHMVKKSDLKAIFGRVSQRAPIVKNSSKHKNLPIPGTGSGLVKFKPSLCSLCNNARTQPHDRAWEELSRHLLSKHPPLKAGDDIRLNQVFLGRVNESLTSVHLYFLKLLGCYAVEHGVPLPLLHFGLCIRNGVAYPYLYITLVSMASVSTGEEVVVGDITTVTVNGQAVTASWYYCIGAVGVHVEYCLPGHPRLHANRGWHPSTVKNTVRMQ